ncbi:MAG: cysteine hydrolase family protein [Cocleimonas sp.]
MNKHFNNKTLLLLIDLQNAIDHPSWGKRNNLEAEENITNLLTHWRDQQMPIVHIKHMSTDPNSHYRPNQPGNDFRTSTMPIASEEVIEKNSHSAFIGTTLEENCRSRNINQIVAVGVITNNSIEATARMSGNLGFDTTVVSDACYTFDKRDYGGTWHSAQTIHDIALANLENEYAQIMSTREILN